MNSNYPTPEEREKQDKAREERERSYTPQERETQKWRQDRADDW